VLAAIEFGHDCCKKIAKAIHQLMKKAGKTKRVFTPPPVNKDLYQEIETATRAELKGRDEHAEVREAGELRPVDACKKKALEGIPVEQVRKPRSCSTA